jgi:hypothetical protein
MSSAYHPQTDGQTELFTAVMERNLRTFVSNQQDDLVKWLLMAEFVANNQKSASMGASQFIANNGFHPRMNFHLTISSGLQELDPQRMT